MQLNQVTLEVNDMEKACDFYLTLGFTQIVDTPHYARFACYEDLQSAESYAVDRRQAEPTSFSLVLVTHAVLSGTSIYFEHQALDEWIAQLSAKGIVFEQEAQDQAYLWREAVVRDPSGNKIKLYWAGDNRLNPPWRVTKHN